LAFLLYLEFDKGELEKGALEEHAVRDAAAEPIQGSTSVLTWPVPPGTRI
jgi:hypothetical protein